MKYVAPAIASDRHQGVVGDRAVERVRPGLRRVGTPCGSPVGWPFCSQLQKRAASPHVTPNAGQFAAWL